MVDSVCFVNLSCNRMSSVFFMSKSSRNVELCLPFHPLSSSPFLPLLFDSPQDALVHKLVDIVLLMGIRIPPVHDRIVSLVTLLVIALTLYLIISSFQLLIPQFLVLLLVSSVRWFGVLLFSVVLSSSVKLASESVNIKAICITNLLIVNLCEYERRDEFGTLVYVKFLFYIC